MTTTITTAEELAALPVRSQVLAHWPDGSQLDHVSVRIDGNYGGSTSGGYSLLRSHAWCRMVGWGATLTVLYRPDAAHDVEVAE